MITQGWNSYAAHLEKRIVTQSWVSHQRSSGRFTFRRIYEGGDSSYNSATIGHEMCERVQYGYSHRLAPRKWYVQCYADGVALYRKESLRWLINNRRTFSPIDQVMNHYYFVDREVADQEDGSMLDTILVMRRKPVSVIARQMSLGETNLGDFLVSRYNVRGEADAVLQG